VPIHAITLKPVVPDRRPDTRRGDAGLSLDGVKLEGSAPVERVLGAYAIVDFGDCSEQISPVADCNASQGPPGL